MQFNMVWWYCKIISAITNIQFSHCKIIKIFLNFNEASFRSVNSCFVEILLFCTSYPFFCFYHFLQLSTPIYHFFFCLYYFLFYFLSSLITSFVYFTPSSNYLPLISSFVYINPSTTFYLLSLICSFFYIIPSFTFYLLSHLFFHLYHSLLYFLPTLISLTLLLSLLSRLF